MDQDIANLKTDH